MNIHEIWIVGDNKEVFLGNLFYFLAAKQLACYLKKTNQKTVNVRFQEVTAPRQE